MTPWLEQMWDMASAQFWQVTTVGIIGLLLAKTVFRRRPQVAYVLLMLVIVKALIPPVVPGYSRMFDWSWAEAASSQNVPAAQPFAGVDPNERVVAEAHAPESDAGMLADFEKSHSTKSSFMRRFPLWALLLWSIGVVATGFYVVTTWIRRMRTLCQGSRAAHPALIDLLNEVSSSVGSNRNVRLLISDHEGPCSFGVVAPTIVLPRRLIHEISEQNLKLILAHELIHVRRGDGLAACFQVAAIVLWWFHPVVWLVSRQLSQEREKCCDVDVLESTKCKPANYAQGLLEALKVTTTQSHLSLESGFGSAEFTQERLMMIMNRTESTVLARRWFFWSLFAIGLVAIVPGKFSVAQSSGKSSVAPTESIPEGAATPEDAATRLFRASITNSPAEFMENLLLGVCDGPIDTLNKYAECLHATTYSNGESSFTVYDLPMRMKKETVRVVASQAFTKDDVDSLRFQFLSTYYGKQFLCVEVAADNYDGLQYQTRIVVAKQSDGWYAMPRCRSSKSFYQIADAMRLTAAKSEAAK